MAFFHPHPHAYHAQQGQGFTPLFRMLEDFDRYSTANSITGARQGVIRAFQPKFDVRETEAAYELHGELAGVDRDNVHIEFSDPQNMTVRGRVERVYTAGTPPAGLLNAQPTGDHITEAGEEESADKDEQGGGEYVKSPSPHRATVEDEGEAESAETHGTPAVATPATTVTAPATRTRDTAKYWITERSIGEFSRSFNFPQRVEQEGTTANLNGGILTVVVPKAKKHEARRIHIS